MELKNTFTFKKGREILLNGIPYVLDKDVEIMSNSIDEMKMKLKEMIAFGAGHKKGEERVKKAGDLAFKIRKSVITAKADGKGKVTEREIMVTRDGEPFASAMITPRTLVVTLVGERVFKMDSKSHEEMLTEILGDDEDEM